MLKIHKMALGLYQTNAYIIHDADSKTCCVIDPGYEAPAILREVEHLGLSVEAILLTHGHFDHVGAVKDMVAETDCDVYICDGDLSLPPMFTNGKLYYSHTYAEGDVLHLAGLEISVLHTPGHTPGSVCLICENTIFSGDTLFDGSCGRTDIGGSWPQIQSSLARLASLDTDYVVYPGHGGSTTLAAEKRYNPYMK